MVCFESIARYENRMMSWYQLVERRQYQKRPQRLELNDRATDISPPPGPKPLENRYCTYGTEAPSRPNLPWTEKNQY